MEWITFFLFCERMIAPRAEQVLFDENDMTIVLKYGHKLSVSLVYFPRLLQASLSELKSYILSGCGLGIHWESLDEDISVEGLLLGTRDCTNRQHLAIAEEAYGYKIKTQTIHRTAVIPACVDESVAKQR